MAKVIMVCGRICSGKTTYSARLCDERGAVLLSVDEIMLAVFGQYAGERHDEYVAGVKRYLLKKSTELIKRGVDVVLDWGFWQRSERNGTREFYLSRGVECELRYIDISDETWRRRVESRNRAVLEGDADAYFVDENLARKFASLFETPDKKEVDIWVTE